MASTMDFSICLGLGAGLHVFEMMTARSDELTEATTQQLCHIRSPGFVSEVPRSGLLAEFVRLLVRVATVARSRSKARQESFRPEEVDANFSCLLLL